MVVSGDEPGSQNDALGDFDLDASTNQAWNSFAARLADVLSVMDAGATLRIGAIAGSSEGAAPYVSFSCGAAGRLDAHAAGSAELGEEYRLGAAQLALLATAGWAPPTADGPDAHAGFLLSGTQEESRVLADAAVRVLREVYGVAHPAFLAPDQLAEILTPPPVAELPDSPVFDADDLRAIVPAGLAELDAVIARELTELLGHEPVRDRDGDFAIRVGSTMVFVRASQDAQEVLVFAAIVHDVEGRSRAMEVLSDLNTDARFVRFLLIRDRVFVSLSVFAHPFVPAHLHQALSIVSVIGDRIDDELAAKLRGRTTFTDADGEEPG